MIRTTGAVAAAAYDSGITDEADVSRAAGRPRRTTGTPAARYGHALLGAAAALVFLAEASVRLGAQGLQHEEVYQAVGSFAWVGHDVHSPASWRGIPILSMRYAGATQTTLYGLYLRLAGASFTVETWRLTSLLQAAAGIFLFGLLAGRDVGWPPLAAFYALVLTDTGLILGCRFYDASAVSFEVLLELVLLGLWFRDTGSAEAPARTSFLTGLLVGLAIYGKLHAVALLVPAALFLFADPRRRARKQAAALALGLALGTAPLAYANLRSWALSRELVSLTTTEHAPRSLASFGSLYGKVLTLGAAPDMNGFVFGAATPPLLVAVEACGVFALVVCALAAARDRSRTGTLARVCLISWAVIPAVIWLLPAWGWVHHWTLATAFLYAGAALAFLSARERARRRALLAALAALLVVRAPTLVRLERALRTGAHSMHFDPSLTRLGLFAASRPDDVLFVAVDWGVTYQIRCLSNDRPGLVVDPFWTNDVAAVTRALEARKRVFYLVRLKDAPNVGGHKDSLEQELGRLAGWHEEPLDPELASMAAVWARKFVKD